MCIKNLHSKRRLGLKFNKNQNIILFFSLSLLTNHRHSRLRENDDG